ncbi:flightin [Chrysoperla carnea]|uniref:flightin n=1 Tax=Chrysoperla carnea TaxID=189513 RepID=UPI001D066E4F|nr:flightin [Chrysoperla carnea]
MADDDPWVIEDPEEAARAEADAAEAAVEVAAVEGAKAAAAAEPAKEEELPPTRPPAPRDPNKLVLCRHWVRPKFLNYSYLYDYRHKYYDDVIDYLNKRQRGLIAEIPRAQEWAERAFRVYTSKGRADNLNYQFRTNIDSRSNAKFYRYHSSAYVHRTYAKYLNH